MTDVRVRVLPATAQVRAQVAKQVRAVRKRDEKNRMAHGLGYHDAKRVPTCRECA